MADGSSRAPQALRRSSERRRFAFACVRGRNPERAISGISLSDDRKLRRLTERGRGMEAGVSTGGRETFRRRDDIVVVNTGDLPVTKRSRPRGSGTHLYRLPCGGGTSSDGFGFASRRLFASSRIRRNITRSRSNEHKANCAIERVIAQCLHWVHRVPRVLCTGVYLRRQVTVGKRGRRANEENRCGISKELLLALQCHLQNSRTGTTDTEGQAIGDDFFATERRLKV
ncbi:unnamed protein product [Darwinula stevensoni]|uniref:Uncharacterized protein n=1 Tax=Darwinula stevensoni TaxID=69355 RepID=A0A7R9A8M5_9CRUS|nr:unnamed protein product [Darwinula stevensoni]CAG0896534.1 unnamed protein product [Darwinula stevensoni]